VVSTATMRTVQRSEEEPDNRTQHDNAGAHARCAERTARGRRPYEPDRV